MQTTDDVIMMLQRLLKNGALSTVYYATLFVWAYYNSEPVSAQCGIIVSVHYRLPLAIGLEQPNAITLLWSLWSTKLVVGLLVTLVAVCCKKGFFDYLRTNYYFTQTTSCQCI